MTFKKAADGVTKQGKTKGKNLGDSGPNVGIQTGKGSKGASTVTSASMKAVGRNLARAKNQG
jgi:ketol-acid reductoisomerase